MWNKSEKIGKYSLVKKLGKGAFGEVFHVTYNQQDYALKKLFAHKMDPLVLTRFLNECQNIEKLRKSVKNKHIIEIVDILKEQNSYVMEFLKESSYEYFDRTKDFSFLDKLIHSVYQLHQLNIIHRDIKPENIRVRNNDPVIIDFGIASWWDSRSNLVIVGTPFYSPPEMASWFKGTENIGAAGKANSEFLENFHGDILEKGRIMKKLHDVYSLGITIGVLITGVHPFNKDTHADYLKTGSSEDLDRWIKLVPAPYQDFVKASIQFYPEKRPSLEQLIDTFDFLKDDMPSIQHTADFVLNEEDTFYCLDCHNETYQQDLCSDCGSPLSTAIITIKPQHYFETVNLPENASISDTENATHLSMKLIGDDYKITIGRDETSNTISFPDDFWLSKNHGIFMKKGSELYYCDNYVNSHPTNPTKFNGFPIGRGKAKIISGSYLLAGSLMMHTKKCYQKP